MRTAQSLQTGRASVQSTIRFKRSNAIGILAIVAFIFASIKWSREVVIAHYVAHYWVSSKVSLLLDWVSALLAEYWQFLAFAGVVMFIATVLLILQHFHEKKSSPWDF